MVSSAQIGALLKSSRIVMIGASERSVWSSTVYANLSSGAGVEELYLISPRNAKVHGQRAYTSCEELPGPVDLAFVMVPGDQVQTVIADTHRAGIPNLVLLSSGFGEAGEAGRTAQARLVATAAAHGQLLLGPNMLGFANLHAGVPAIAVPQAHALLPGRVALLSQSGASAGSMASFAQTSGVGLSHLVTLGNEAMVTAGHVLDYLVDDPRTDAIAMFLETIRDPAVFARAAARAAAADKPVVVLKVGSSPLASATAAAHTGALVGDGAVTSAVLERLGVIQVDSIEDMILTAATAAHLGRLEGEGLGVVSISGGACDIIADVANDEGLTLPALSADAAAAIGEALPSFGTAHNPVDITGAALGDPRLFEKSIVAVGAELAVGAVAVVNSVPWHEGLTKRRREVMEAIGAGFEQAQTGGVLLTQAVHPVPERLAAELAELGIGLVVPGLNHGVRALARTFAWSRHRGPYDLAVPEQAHLQTSQGLTLSEWESRQALERAGVPCVPAVVARSADEAVELAAQFGVVAMKMSGAIAHKSDIGGVLLSIEGEEAVREAWRLLHERAAHLDGLDGVLVSPMRDAAVELLVAVTRDPQWGPILAVGLGGILVEVLNEVALVPLPARPEDVRRALESLRGAEMLNGVRGRPGVNWDALVAAVLAVTEAALAVGDRLVTLEVNPMRVDESGAEALDALVVLASESEVHDD